LASTTAKNAAIAIMKTMTKRRLRGRQFRALSVRLLVGIEGMMSSVSILIEYSDF
jgi:hypothetical protein